MCSKIQHKDYQFWMLKVSDIPEIFCNQQFISNNIFSESVDVDSFLMSWWLSHLCYTCNISCSFLFYVQFL